MSQLIVMIVLLGITVLITGFISKSRGYSDSEDSYKDIAPADARKKLANDKEIILVDVRTSSEYQQKHIPKSILIPLDVLEKEAPQQLPNKEATILVYCQSGGRSAKASAKLSAMGYNNIYNLGGIASWPYDTETGK